ncbi:MAG: MoaD/ThiS family protein [Thermoanaerobacter sp.]|uniref:MoaD/ThiS family protein n=1 Tax=unclassified Thermoanaerobacter TaxID=2636821 RepID=UPI0004A33FC9|nr:MoaD/ThiS family protein [Thermoanaerobacter sp. CM-CNRG TB177]
MLIKVKLFATFREGRQKEVNFDYFEGITGRFIINKLNIKEKDVAIFLVNGLDGKLDDPLSDGDVISLFPPVGGG